MAKGSMQNRYISNQKIENPFVSDAQFDGLFPYSIQHLTKQHWTPLYVARKAAGFLATEKGARVLDIGSGVGKFCLAAASMLPDAFFYGVEQRSRLVYYADKVKNLLRLENVSFRYSNFTQLNFCDYDHFYFYNSFYENFVGTDKIDHSLYYSTELYHYYNRYLYKQLEKRPPGTKLVTYQSLEDEVPKCYRVVGMERNNLLKFWRKI
ncbi:MAG: methyltransferase domain-containing protein [Bacteroidetes bacterium]|nr:MAG: methyltransferase domain-containing protein [Bacteroidota bacterium]